jgi:thioredoxin 1
MTAKPSTKAQEPAPKPYTDLTSEDAVERLMAPGGGAGVIDFWAPWCAPCRALAPHFEAVAQKYADSSAAVRFYKVNTEASPRLAQSFNVRSIPTMIFVNEGEILDVIIGAVDARRLAGRVEWLLSRARGEGFWDRLLGRRRSAPSAGGTGDDPSGASGPLDG